VILGRWSLEKALRVFARKNITQKTKTPPDLGLSIFILWIKRYIYIVHKKITNDFRGFQPLAILPFL